MRLCSPELVIKHENIKQPGVNFYYKLNAVCVHRCMPVHYKLNAVCMYACVHGHVSICLLYFDIVVCGTIF